MQKNAQWIEKKRTALKNRAPLPNLSFTEGENVPLLGKNYILHLYNGKRVGFVDNYIYVPSDAPKDRLIHFYRETLRKVVTPLLESYATRMGVQYKGLSITSAKGRWGSCSGKNSINFSFHLVLCDPSAIEYVVVHELCHILQKNHSKLFWMEVGKYYPNYAQARKYLKDKSFYMEII